MPIGYNFAFQLLILGNPDHQWLLYKITKHFIEWQKFLFDIFFYKRKVILSSCLSSASNIFLLNTKINKKIRYKSFFSFSKLNQKLTTDWHLPYFCILYIKLLQKTFRVQNAQIDLLSYFSLIEEIMRQSHYKPPVFMKNIKNYKNRGCPKLRSNVSFLIPLWSH